MCSVCVCSPFATTAKGRLSEKNNQYLAQNVSWLSEAKALLNQNGSLSEAALLLEAAIQNGELGVGGYEAWILLGETRNMDEREEAGIKALTEGVRLAREAGAAGAGMLVGLLLIRKKSILIPL
jgi:peroxin-5